MVKTNRMNSSRGAAKVWAMGVLLAVTGSAAMSVWAQGDHPSRGGFRGGEAGMMLGSPEHMSRGLQHMLKSVNATDAQKAQIEQIAKTAATDLKGQREAGRKLHEQGAALLTAPTVDANAIESVRQQGQALRDQASRRTTQALVDISNVLTPDQRAKLAELRQQRAAKMQQHRQQRPGAASAPARS